MTCLCGHAKESHTGYAGHGEYLCVECERGSDEQRALSVHAFRERRASIKWTSTEPALVSWYPIESAPKDGTKILAVRKGYIPCVVYWMEIEGFKPGWAEVGQELTNWSDENYRPTHWTPLPEFK